jgi:RecB family exonuclease
MKLTSLSATAAQVFELCEARWRAERVDWASSPGSRAAGLGTVCHAALEHFVHDKIYDDLTCDQELMMLGYYTKAYEAQFADKTHFEEGLALVLRWMRRQVWAGRRVLSTEVKENFMLPTSIGRIPVNFIWDRCDEMADGTIEVVDYKTNVAPLTHEDLMHNVQARLYGLAAQIKFPSAEMIWVTFDYLRHQPVGVRFTKEQNAETYRYMRRLAERIIVSEGKEETLNDQCKWCVRRHACGKLRDHVKVGGILGITDPAEAADRRRDLDAVAQAVKVMIEELDQVILAHMDDIEETEFKTDHTEVKLDVSSRRHVDDRLAAAVLGPDIMAKYGSLTMANIDALLKGKELDDVQKKELRELIFPKLGNPRVKTTKVPVL